HPQPPQGRGPSCAADGPSGGHREAFRSRLAVLQGVRPRRRHHVLRAVGRADTAILPLLNGLRHMDVLTEHFGRARMLGGECLISVALDSDSRIVHMGTTDSLPFGEQDGSRSDGVTAIESVLSGPRFEARLSESILQEMWEKWVSISTFA